MKAYPSILFVLAILCLCSCQSIHYASNGKVEQSHTNIMQYSNTDIGLLSQNFYANKISISANFIRQLKLPIAYKKALLQTNDSCMVLYSMKKINASDFYLAKVYETNQHVLNLEQEIKKEISVHASISDVKYYQFPNKENIVKIHYGILCNSKSAYNIHDYLVQWSPDKIIRITHIVSPYWLHLWEIGPDLLLLIQTL
jgi:hypothetical protein